MKSSAEICVKCQHSRAGIPAESRCPECGTLPLVSMRPNESQRSFIGLARFVLVAGTLTVFTIGASDGAAELIRVPSAIVAGGASWNWPQLWLSEPAEWRARARTRLGLIMGLWLGLALSGRWVLGAVLRGADAPEWLVASLALVLMAVGVVVGLHVGVRRAAALGGRRSEPSSGEGSA